MARTKIAEPCLICEQIGCRCGKPPKAEKPARKRVPRTPAAPAAPEPAVVREPVQQVPVTPSPVDDPAPPKQSARAAMKARAARSRPAQPARVVGHDPTEAAIRALAPILHPDDRAKFSHLINRHSDVTIRAATWRQRRYNA